MTTYADAFDALAKKEGKYEKALQTAQQANNTTAINSAQRMLQRIGEMKEQLFQAQEASKPPEPQAAFAYGGEVPMLPIRAMGGRFFDPEEITLRQGNWREGFRNRRGEIARLALTTSPALPKAPLRSRFTDEEEVTERQGNWRSALRERRETDLANLTRVNYPTVPAGFTPATGPEPFPDLVPNLSMDDPFRMSVNVPMDPNRSLATPTVASPTLQLPPVSYKLPAQETSSVSGMRKAWNNIQLGAPGALNALGSVLPYAGQFVSDFLALKNLKNLKVPVDLPGMDAPMMDTTVDTGASQQAIYDSAAAYGRGIAQNSASSTSANALSMTASLAGSRQSAQLLQDKANTERGLRNEQAEQLTQTRNQNARTAAENAQRRVDFDNEVLNAKMGIWNNIGTKAAGVSQDVRRAAADKRALDVYSRQFDKDLLRRNFGDLDWLQKFLNAPTTKK